MRLACSDDTLADKSNDVYMVLQQKRPSQHPDSSLPPAPAQSGCIIKVSEDEVFRTINSFPARSVGGPDGLRPQHLKGMIGSPADGS